MKAGSQDQSLKHVSLKLSHGVANADEARRHPLSIVEG